MTLLTNTITEYHTSDFGVCPRATLLRHQGKQHRKAQTALVRGVWADEALGYVHHFNNWNTESAVAWAEEETKQKLIDDNRPLSDSVVQNWGEIRKQVGVSVQHYIDRLKPFFDECELIGVQVPIRMEIDLPSGLFNFASHLDLLFRGPTRSGFEFPLDQCQGMLCCWDWKFRDATPTMSELSRNYQMMLYSLALEHGSVCTDPLTGTWENLGEMADMAWVDLARFKPYMKKTVSGEHTFKKGDPRPLENIVRRFTFNPEKQDLMLDEIAQRVAMMDAGVFPMSPSDGCNYCESNAFCAEGGLVI